MKADAEDAHVNNWVIFVEQGGMKAESPSPTPLSCFTPGFCEPCSFSKATELIIPLFTIEKTKTQRGDTTCIQDTEPTVVEKMRLGWVTHHRNHVGNHLTDEFKLSNFPIL